MTTIKDIRTKINNTKNMQKITSAMRMVAVGKMRKAQDRMKASRPYAEKLLNVIAHLASAHPQYRHAYLNVRKINRVGFIVVTTDRGLCGSLNINVLKETLKSIQSWKDKKVEHDLCLVGNKADLFFRRFGGNIVAKGYHTGDEPEVKDIIGAVKVMLDSFEFGRIDALFVCYNKFINTMKQRPVIQQLLPIDSPESKRHYWDYIYEPHSFKLLEHLLSRYIEAEVYQSIVENIASEQAARMLAMMNATDNADALIDDLRIIYNRERQTAITREIAEIVGGAEAISHVNFL